MVIVLKTGLESFYPKKAPDATFRMHNKTIELVLDQGDVELSRDGAAVCKTECHNKERNRLIGDLQFEGDCCYFTLSDPRGERIRDHYCFNTYLNRVEYMFSDEYEVPQPKEPVTVFTLNDVKYGLHVNREGVEISKDGVLLKRLEHRDKKYIYFTGKTHIYKDSFYFFLRAADGPWCKLCLFNPNNNFFEWSAGEIQNPEFSNNRVISTIVGGRLERYENVVYTYELLQGPALLKQVEHYITGYHKGLPSRRYIALEN